MERALYLNLERCCGCGACTVACLDHNDIEIENQPALRRVYQVEAGSYPEVSIAYVSAACLHCQDSPCVMGCLTGAIRRHERTGAVLVDQNLCIGCHSCAMACPFGVPRFGKDDKMQKCELCTDWVEAGLEPACVRVCPIGALEYKSPNEVSRAKESAFAQRITSAAQKGLPA